MTTLKKRNQDKTVTQTLAQFTAVLSTLNELLDTVRGQKQHVRPSVPLRKALLHADLAVQHLSDVGRFVEQRRRATVEKDPFQHLAADLSRRTVEDLFQVKTPASEAGGSAADPAAGPLATMPTPSKGRGFRGYTQVIPLPDLIGFVSLQCQSGLLTIVTNQETVEMVFEDGNLIHMHSRNPPPGARLGDVLVELGMLDQKTLNENLGKTQSGRQRLGAALVAGDLVSREDLRRALEHQVSALFQRLVKSQEASFSYEEGMPDDMDRRYSLSVTHLMLDCARLLDEAAILPKED